MRTPPYDERAERACLGAVLLDNNAMILLESKLDAEQFYLEAHGEIFRTMVALRREGKAIDHLTLSSALRERGQLERCGGSQVLDRLTDSVVVVANVEHYVDVVRNHSLVRTMINVAQEVAARGYSGVENVEEFLDTSRSEVIAASTGSSRGGPVRLGDDLVEAYTDLEKGKMPDGLVRTGIDKIDSLVGGLWPGLLTILGARPSMGKSAFCLNVLTNAAIAGKRVLYVPTEDARRYVVLRELARFGDVDLNNLMMREVPGDAWQRLVDAGNQLKHLPLWIDDSPGLSADRIARVAALHRQAHGLDLLVVDHLGEIVDRGENKTALVEDACRGLRDLAKELDIPVLLATQLNREVEYRKDKRPMLHDLRQSGAIEQMARTVWFLYRRGYYQAGAEEDPDLQLIVAKSSHGKPGSIRLWSDLSRMYIRGWETDRDGPWPDEGGQYVAPENGGFFSPNDY